MAKCQFCQLDMNVADGCVAERIAGRERIRYGGEKRYGGDLGELLSGLGAIGLPAILFDEGGAHLPEPARCPDCAAKRGEFHHPGCDWEECPFCGLQLISCACNARGNYFNHIEAAE